MQVPKMRLLPQGGSLPEENWNSRHRAILVLLWAHVPTIAAVAYVRGASPAHAVFEVTVVTVLAAAASDRRLSRRVRVLTSSLGLLTSSAVLVHLSGGVIEVHFHFFVMVAVVALYQDWVPFLAAIGYVLLHHGVVGVLDPSSVYNHPAALESPWKWAGIHAFFIAGISAACLVTWKLNEQLLNQRKEAEEKLREERQIVETLNDVGKTLAAELDLTALLKKVTDAGTSLTSAQFGAFFYNVTDENGESYLLHALSGTDASEFEGFGSPRNTAIFGPTFAGEAIVRVDDVTKDPRYGKNSPHFGIPAGHPPVRSYLAVPVVSRGHVHGGLFFGHPMVGVFNESDEQLAAGIAAHAALAVDNARLYEEEIRTRRSLEGAKSQLELMAEASKILFSSLDVETILRGLVSVAVPALSDAGAVLVTDERSQSQQLIWKVGQAPVQTDACDGRALSGTATELESALTGKLEVLSPVPDGWLAEVLGETRLPEQLGGSSLESVALIPLTRRDRTVGLLMLFDVAESERAIEDLDQTLASEIARRASVALENALLYSTQRGVSETLQHSLLPEHLPWIPGMNVTAKYVPGGPGVEVGGDWYDFFDLGNGKFAIAMGDVAGRGVPAASLMGQLRNALRAHGLEGGSPAEVLTSINRNLLAMDTEQMATLFYSVIDLESSELVYASAGHPPPILVTGEGISELLETNDGLPLGTMRQANFSEHRVEFPAGATLLVYTDGLVEDAATQFDAGLQRVRSLLDASASDDVVAISERVLTGAMRDRERTDDVALLVLKMQPVTSSFHLRVPLGAGSAQALRSYLRRWLRSLGASDKEMFEIVTAAGEACANAIVHSAVGASYFEFEGELNGQLRLTVTDPGRWGNRTHSGHGRGLNIIREFMDGVQVKKGEDFVQIEMVRDLEITLSA